MTAILIGLYGIALCYTLIIIDLKRQPISPHRDVGARFNRYLLATWFVSSVFFGGRFFTIKPPGFFDITIERILFAPLTILVAFDLMRGVWRYRKDFMTETLLFILIGLCTISMFNHGFTAVNPAFPNPWFLFISGYLFPTIVYLYVKNRITGYEEIEFVLRVIFGVGFYLAILAYFEFFELRQYVYPQYINDPTVWLHLDRARGPFLNAAVNGLMIVFGFIAGVYLYSRSGRKILGVALLIMIPSIYFSQTRSVYLAFLLCLIGIGFFLRTDVPKWKVFALPIAIVLFLFLALSPRFATTERRAGGVMQIEEAIIRLILIERSIAMITEEPIFGHGFGQFIRAAAERYKGRFPIPGTAEEHQQHNHILGIWAELGIIGVTTYLTIVTRGLVKGARSIAMTFNNKRLRNLSVVLFIGMVAYLVNNLFIEPAFFLAYNGIFFTFLALAENLHLSLVGKSIVRKEGST